MTTSLQNEPGVAPLEQMHAKVATVPAVRLKRWTVKEYDRLAKLGFLNGRRVELINGRILKMPPQKERHVFGVALAFRAALAAFGDQNYFVRPPAPLQQGRRSKPEPDVSVIAGNPREMVLAGNPSDAVLVIEVSETTLAYDRGRKASLYAKNGIADYWIVNLVDNQIEVHRNPTVDAKHKYGFRYASVEFFKPPASVSPLALEHASILVADLLP